MLILPALETFQDASQMGFRSVLVLMKLGFDMRKHYDEVLNEAIPDELIRALDVMGARKGESPEVRTIR
jgi:hypothetical protein